MIIFSFQNVDTGYIAKVTHGFSGADLTEICQRVNMIVFFCLVQVIRVFRVASTFRLG